jgi:hypothetical protein
MDLKAYYEKIHALEAKIGEEFPVIMSLVREGVATEVTRFVAAKMVVEGTARLATPEEARAFRGKGSKPKA